MGKNRAKRWKHPIKNNYDLMASPKGIAQNPKGRPKGKPNKATKTAREIILSVVDNLAPQVQEKFDQLDPKDWLTAYMKLIEFAVPKISPVQAPESIEDRPDVIIEV